MGLQTLPGVQRQTILTSRLTQADSSYGLQKVLQFARYLSVQANQLNKKLNKISARVSNNQKEKAQSTLLSHRLCGTQMDYHLQHLTNPNLSLFIHNLSFLTKIRWTRTLQGFNEFKPL